MGSNTSDFKPEMQKELDLVLYGATGFTGRQAAAYLKQHAPTQMRWAIAGRSHRKLEDLGLNVPILLADATEQTSLDALAARTHVVLNMAGPFKLYGDRLVDACVRTGTDYADISGETARIRRLIDRYHGAAQAASVKIVNFCGVSSLPADLGVYLLERHLDGDLERATALLNIAGGAFNGGTVASMSDAIESGDAVLERNPFLLGPDTGRPPLAIEKDPTGLRHDRDLNAWISRSPLGVSDTRAVRRSASLNDRDIIFQEYLAFNALRPAVSVWATLSLLNLLFRIKLTRRIVQQYVRPGSGPSEKQMDKGWFNLRITGMAHDRRTATIAISGQGDPGNRITVKCACESALALALDKASLPKHYGVLTPSVAIGNCLAERLVTAGMTIQMTQPSF